MSTPLDQYLAASSLATPHCMVYRRGALALREAGLTYLHGRLLDIGCGAKQKEILLGDLVGEYVGLDLPVSLHDQSKVDLFGTAYEIPQPEASFDCVLCTAVLEHLEEPEAALREAYRVMKPGACAIYTIPMYWHLHEEPRDFYRYTRYGIAHLASKAGFEVVEIRPLSGFLMTFATEANYFVQRFRRGPFRYLVDAWVAMVNLAVPWLDTKFHSPQFTWLNLAVFRKPTSDSAGRTDGTG